MSAGATACAVIGGLALLFAYQSEGGKSESFFLIALFALIGACSAA